MAKAGVTWLWWSKPFWDPILGVFGEFTPHFRIYFRGDWDVHGGILTHGQVTLGKYRGRKAHSDLFALVQRLN